MSIVQIPSVAHCQLWRVDLDVVPGPEAAACLSNEEWERAHRFVFARDRHRYVAAHSALRSTLSAHTGIAGAFLDFTHGAFGKPTLIEPAGVRFNLSHSQSVGLIAISRMRRSASMSNCCAICRMPRLWPTSISRKRSGVHWKSFGRTSVTAPSCAAGHARKPA